MKKNIIYLVLIIFFLPIIVSCSDEKKNKTENPDIVISENQSISQSEDKLILDMLYNADISEETVDMITDIAYWEKLGLSKDDIRYTCLKAFIEGDTAKLAEINDKSLPIEAYNIYKTVEIGEYTITYQENPNDSSGDVMFHVNIISSGVSYYPVGEHSFIAHNGIDGNYIRDPQIIQRIEYNTEAQETLFRWFNMSGTYELYDYSSLQGEFQELYSYWITDYLQYTLRNENMLWTIDEMQKYAEKYFGIVDFMPPKRMLTDNGIYDIYALGGSSWYYKYIDEYADDSLVTLTVQFYSDAPMIIASHIIEYKLQKIEGGYKILESKTLYKSPYEPMHYVV